MLNVNLLPAQEEYMSITHPYTMDIACYQGGYGSGKTFCGTLLGVLLCLQFPGIKGLVGAQTFPLLRDTTLEKWFEHLDIAGLKRYKDWNYNVTSQRLKFSNGSEVFFRHFEEPGKLRSLEVGFIEIEEMSQIPESTFLELMGRLRQSVLPGGEILPMRRIFGHTNPETSKGWIWKYFVEKTISTKSVEEVELPFEHLGRTGITRIIKKIIEEEVEGNKVCVQYRLIIAPTTQNFYLPADQLANFKASYDPEYYRINVLGEFGDYSSGLVTKGFNSARQIVPITVQQGLPLHLTCDFNKDPMAWYVCQKDADNVYFLDEICLEHTDTEHTILEFMRRYPAVGYPFVIVNGDASGAWGTTSSTNGSDFTIMLNHLKRNGYKVSPYPHIPPRNPEISDRINAWNAMIRNANDEHRIFFNGYYDKSGDLVSTCPRLIHAMENLKFHPGTGDILLPTKSELRRDRNMKFDEHVFDAASYLVWYYFKITRDVTVRRQPRSNFVDSRFNMIGEI